MNKDDVKKLDEITTEEAAGTQELSSEELDNVNGGRIRFKPKKWWSKLKGEGETDGAKPDGRGASGGW